MNQPPNTLIPLTNEGDLILDVTDFNRLESRSFLISSCILAMASPVFAEMRFEECLQVQENQQQNASQVPSIQLDAENVDAMNFILSSLHHKADRMSNNLSAPAIAEIAVQSNKYDFRGALVPWIRLCCHLDRFPLLPSSKVRDMGYGLLAAYLFQSPSLTTMSASYVKSLPPDFAVYWKDHKGLSRLPKVVRVRLAEEIARAQKEIRPQVLSKIDELQYNETFCSTTSRFHTTQYLDMLRYFGIWPCLRVFETSSVSDLVSLIQGLSNSPTHGCLHHDIPSCPLRIALRELSWVVCAIRDNMEGVPFSVAMGVSAKDENCSGDYSESTMTGLYGFD